MIGGWKTKTGVICAALGGALLAGAEFAPTQQITVWMKFIGTICAAFGGSLGVYGVAAKVEKKGSAELPPIVVMLAMCVIASIMVAACADFNWGMVATPSNNIDAQQGPICDREEFKDSIICAQLRANGIANAEDARDLILDANDIALILDAYTVDQLAVALDKWDKILDDGGFSYALYFSGLMKDTEKAQRISGILKRRFGYLLQVNDLIIAPDIKILKLLNQRIREASGIK